MHGSTISIISIPSEHAFYSCNGKLQITLVICILAIAQKEASSEGEGIERKVPTEQEKEIPHYITFTLAQSPA